MKNGWYNRDNDPVTAAIPGPTPCISIKKQISVDGGPWLDADTIGTAPSVPAPHGAMYQLIVTNCGSVDLTNVTISDATLGIVNFNIGNLAAGASIIVDSGTIPSLNQPLRCENPGNFENIADAQGTDPSGAIVGPVFNPAWLVCTPTPAITVAKECTDAPGPGQPINFSGTVTNTGNETLNNVTVTDSFAGLVLGPISLAPLASANYSGSYVPSLPGPSTDTVTATGTGAISGSSVSSNASATCNIIVAPAIAVTKQCTDAPAPGQPINFSGTVTNTGNETLNNVTVTDSFAGLVLGPISLAPLASANYSGSYVPSLPGPSTDTVTATGTGAISGSSVSSTASATCNIIVKTDMKLVKWCHDAPAPGMPITFIALLANTGNETLNGISCADNPPAALVGVPASLAPGGWAVISGSYIPASPGLSTDTLTCSGTGAISSITITRSASATCNSPSTTTTTTCPTTTTTKPTTTTTKPTTTTTKPTTTTTKPTTTTTKPTTTTTKPTTTTTKPTTTTTKPTTTTTKPTTTTTTKPPTCPGTGTPGYWKNHPEAWPVDYITIGGVSYSKSKAIYWMSKSDGDKTITMFRSLVAAKLNILIGNDSGCIASTITLADNWLKTYNVGSGVSASSSAWKKGEPLYLMLDKYNNGLLCCPSRDYTGDPHPTCPPK